MASITLNPAFTSFSGRLGNIVHYNKYRRQYARTYVKPANPDTESQRFIRRTFGDAVKAWQALPEDEKNCYRKQARKFCISGYNLFISRFMKQNISSAAEQRGGAGVHAAFSQFLRSGHPASVSVSAPLPVLERSGIAVLKAFTGPGAG